MDFLYILRITPRLLFEDHFSDDVSKTRFLGLCQLYQGFVLFYCSQLCPRLPAFLQNGQ